MARTDPQVNFRIPAELKDKLDEAAKNNGRTLTAELILRLETTFELDSLPEPTNPKNITDPEKLEAWAKSILNELLKLKDINNRVERLEGNVEQLEANNYDIENRLNSLDGRGYEP
ncbi:Arc family DNA-binding protein [Acinetobacter sp. Ver3]|uniref:Arc family DNA-binding protein n=1 Tax=Acinetobacter sp. Ver3 TaxID=466088 RepID=UPI00044EB944|nr:Arc family DNA-binding protein [Acinetobacter sp. Ver3]EZQ10735.1 regulatory protein [Acinetobacter sp. Ver3]